MVRVALLLLLLLPLTAIAADARVWLELESASVELGQPLHGALHTRGIGRTPTGGDLKPLEQAFALAQIDAAEKLEGEDKTATGDDHHRLAFTLYPRRSGKLTLPALSLSGSHSEPMAITVTEAKSQGVALTITPTISTTRPWVREQVLVTLEVITPDRFAGLVIEPQPLPGFEVIPLAAERERIETADGERTRLRTGLALFALLPGNHKVRLPPVQYRLDGGTRRLFPLPEPVLEVKALPPYVPPTLPVGKLSIGSTLEPASALQGRELGFWHITVQAESVPTHWLPPLRKILISSDDIRFLPAKSAPSVQPDSTGVHAQRDYHVPFIPQANGRLSLPDLTLQYFDPASGRLERIVHNPARPLVLGTPARVAAGVIILSLLLYGAPKVWRKGVALRRRQRERRAALADLEMAEDAAALRAALRRYAAAAGGSGNLTMSEWQQRFGGTIQSEEITALAVASYDRRQDIDLHALRDRLMRKLKRQRQSGLVPG